jgi:UDP-N-acetylmuramate--alanine ligase
LNLNKYTYIYFIGIGGIGMSAIARYFNSQGKHVAGYDRTVTRLSEQLEEEKIRIHYTDDVQEIPSEYKDPNKTLVIFTPAIPNSHSEYPIFH